MRITVRQLRRIIKEELNSLDQMAWAGNLPIVDAQGTVDPQDDDPRFKEPRLSLKAVDKFHSNPLFAKKATAAFKDYKTPIWILPVKINHKSSKFWQPTEEGRRYDIFDDPNLAVEALRGGGVPEPTLQQIHGILSNGGTVIANVAAGLRTNFFPTPWMMIHAIFDSEKIKFFDDVYQNVYKMLFTDPISVPTPKNPDRKLTISTSMLPPLMTMRSARKGKITPHSPEDVVAEMLTQEMVTTRGVHFNEPESTMRNYFTTARGMEFSDSTRNLYNAVGERLEEVKVYIKSQNLKERFDDLIAGKLIVLETARPEFTVDL